MSLNVCFFETPSTPELLILRILRPRRIEAAVEGAAGDAEDGGGEALVATDPVDDVADVAALDFR